MATQDATLRGAEVQPGVSTLEVYTDLVFVVRKLLLLGKGGFLVQSVGGDQ